MKTHKNIVTNQKRKLVLPIIFPLIGAYKRERPLITYHYLILPNNLFMFCVGQKTYENCHILPSKQ